MVSTLLSVTSDSDAEGSEGSGLISPLLCADEISCESSDDLLLSSEVLLSEGDALLSSCDDPSYDTGSDGSSLLSVSLCGALLSIVLSALLSGSLTETLLSASPSETVGLSSEVSKEFNSEKIQDEKEFTFTFYEKKIKIRQNDKLETYIIKYNELYRVYKTEDFYYLYTDSRHSLLINTNSFIIGNSEDFSEFIKKKCKFKYKDKNM